MFSSLRTRLWISYAFIILVVLCMVSIGIFLAFSRTPILYRNTILRLRVASGVVAQRIEPVLQNPRRDIQAWMEKEAANRRVRLVLLDRGGSEIADTGQGKLPANLSMLASDQNSQNVLNIPEALSYPDENGKTWFYVVEPVASDYFLFTSIARPDLAIRTIIRDDLITPLFRAGLIALAVAFILGLLLARWISIPLRNMADNARNIHSGKMINMNVDGPEEVKEVGLALNEMVEKVQTSQQSQRDFVANLSHELRTPLTSIQGYAQAIMDGTVNEPQQLNQAATVIYNEAGRMYRMANDLLSLARLEAGTVEFHMTPVDLSAILKSVIDKLFPQTQANHVVIESDISPLPTIEGDGDRLAQVFTNLIDNALKFTPSDGKIIVSTALSEGSIIVRIADNGPGISPQDQKRIFDRFYQVDRSRKGGVKHGVGLGLPISRQIILAHSGQIWVESITGKGSVFVVKLPVHMEAESIQKKGKTAN